MMKWEEGLSSFPGWLIIPWTPKQDIEADSKSVTVSVFHACMYISSECPSWFVSGRSRWNSVFNIVQPLMLE